MKSIFFVFALVALAVSAAADNDGSKIVSYAKSMVGKYPYSIGGGNDQGPTVGVKQHKPPYCDSRKTIGFDCSGLAKYCVFQATGKSLYHRAHVQFEQCKNVKPLNEKLPGDLVFYATGTNSSTIHHVAIYIGDNEIIEAPGFNQDCTGKLMRKTNLRTNELWKHVCREW